MEPKFELGGHNVYLLFTMAIAFLFAFAFVGWWAFAATFLYWALLSVSLAGIQ